MLQRSQGETVITRNRASCGLILIAALRGAGPSSVADLDATKVHGDWTLTVRDTDGTVAAVHGFKNALAIESGSDSRLARLLGGALVPGKRVVHLNDLTRTVAGLGPDAGKFVLRGSARVLISTTITSVQTEIDVSPSPVCRPSGADAGGERVASKILNPVVPVAQDQLVEVKVVISFS
jgi:hypothetical protein